MRMNDEASIAAGFVVMGLITTVRYLTTVALISYLIHEPLAIGNAEYAVLLVLGNLPANCGPAVRGDADKLKAN